MKWIYWSLMAAVLLAGIGISVYFGVQPKAVPKISLSGFEAPEEMGQAILKRLRLEIQSAPVLFLGVSPEQKAHYQIWQELLKQANEPQWKYDIIVVEKNLPHADLFKEASVPVQSMDLKSEYEQLAEGLKKAQAEKKRIVVIAPSIYISGILKGNIADRLKSENNIKAVSFSTSTFPLTANQEKDMEIPCVLNDQDRSGAGLLGCFIIKSARLTYRKKKVINKYPGAVDQIGSQEYLVLFNPQKFSI